MHFSRGKSLPEMFDIIGKKSFTSMERLSSQPDESRRNDYRHRVKKCLAKKHADVYKCYKKITDYLDQKVLPKILSELSKHMG